MSELAFLDHPERHQQTAVEPPVCAGKYLSITSFKRDRSGVATPSGSSKRTGGQVPDRPAGHQAYPGAAGRPGRGHPRPEPVILAIIPT
jgi:hypothetical protein